MNDELLERLQRLRTQTDKAIELLKNTPLYMIHGFDLSDSPNTFEIGDFVVRDRFWVKNDSTPQNPS